MNPNWFREEKLEEVEGWLAWDRALGTCKDAGPDVAGAVEDASKTGCLGTLAQLP